MASRPTRTILVELRPPSGSSKNEGCCCRSETRDSEASFAFESQAILPLFECRTTGASTSSLSLYPSPSTTSTFTPVFELTKRRILVPPSEAASNSFSLPSDPTTENITSNFLTSFSSINVLKRISSEISARVMEPYFRSA